MSRKDECGNEDFSVLKRFHLDRICQGISTLTTLFSSLKSGTLESGKSWIPFSDAIVRTESVNLSAIKTGTIFLGIAMLRHPPFGKSPVLVSTVLALAALVGVYALGVGSAFYAPLRLFALIVVPLILGWKLYSLSRAV